MTEKEFAEKLKTLEAHGPKWRSYIAALRVKHGLREFPPEPEPVIEDTEEIPAPAEIATGQFRHHMEHLHNDTRSNEKLARHR